MTKGAAQSVLQQFDFEMMNIMKMSWIMGHPRVDLWRGTYPLNPHGLTMMDKPLSKANGDGVGLAMSQFWWLWTGRGWISSSFVKLSQMRLQKPKIDLTTANQSWKKRQAIKGHTLDWMETKQLTLNFYIVSSKNLDLTEFWRALSGKASLGLARDS